MAGLATPGLDPNVPGFLPSNPAGLGGAGLATAVASSAT